MLAVGGGVAGTVVVLRTSGPVTDSTAGADTTATAAALTAAPIAERASIVTLAGGPTKRGVPVDGPARDALLGRPNAIAFDSDDNILVADFENRVIARIDDAGQLKLIAGSGAQGLSDGAGGSAEFYGPVGLAVAGDGTIYVSDGYGHRIRRISATGVVSTLAGGGEAGLSSGDFKDGKGSDARFNATGGIVIDSKGNLLVADYNNNRLRAVSPDGAVTTFAGTGESGARDGQRLQATFKLPDWPRNRARRNGVRD